MASSQDNQPDTSSAAGAGFEWISREEADRRTRVVERLRALEERMSTVENQRAETKWWIRTMIFLASAVAGAVGVLISVVNRWLP